MSRSSRAIARTLPLLTSVALLAAPAIAQARPQPVRDTHVLKSSARAYDDVRARLDRELGEVVDYGRFVDLVVRQAPWSEVEAVVEDMTGPGGFTVFYRTDHGALGSLAGRPYRATQYLIGNPLTARSMLIHDVGAALQVPFRLAVYERRGRTHIDYERPSAALARFDDRRIDAVARKLDAQVARVVSRAIR